MNFVVLQPPPPPQAQSQGAQVPVQGTPNRPPPPAGRQDGQAICTAVPPGDGTREAMDVDIKQQWSQDRSLGDAVLESPLPVLLSIAGLKHKAAV